MNAMGLNAIGWHDIRQKPSGKWEARWAIDGGKVKGKSFLSKEQARKYASDQANGLLNCAVGLTVTKKATAEALSDFLGRSVDESTTELYERRLTEFFAAFPHEPGGDVRPLPAITYINQLSDDAYINRYDKILVANGANPGGRNHHLRIVRTFCRYCVKKKWLAVYPFEDFKMPQSEFEGRPLAPGDFDLMAGPSKIHGNQHDLAETDLWLGRAFRLGRGTMLRISSVWGLTPKHFRAPDQLWVEAIKGQDPVWITLHPDALAVVLELLPGRSENQRLFDYWGSVEAMRNSVADKARRVGLPGIRFHDVCKVTRVSELAAAGWSPAAIAHVSNTSIKTLMTHYIKADRKRSFAEYANFKPQTDGRPTNPRNVVEMGVQAGTPVEIQGIGVSSKTAFNLAENAPLVEPI